ncbi:MAG: FecR domain-containing protein [Chitinophagaceae bacterium]|nr:FecR domain-containing protein [Chitinophagaceae bacterium]
MSKNYIGVEEILCDDRFLSWYFKKDIRATQQWEQWMAGHPGSGPRVQQAVEFLQSLHVHEAELKICELTRAEKRLLEKIKRAQMPVVFFRQRWWIAAAGIITLAVGAYAIQEHRAVLHTAYGEIKDHQLPDGTEVVVNADSRVTYSPGWTDGKDREVWLTGEAFFHVRRTPLKSRFIVHTGHFDVIVTGTKFNVVSRQEKANVMLQEGRVILHMREGKELKMTPGDFAEYSDDRLVKRSVKTDSLIAWKDHKLSFDATPIRDVVSIIREQYGVTVRLENETVANKTVSGIMPNDNLNILLKSLEATADFTVIRQGNEIIIQDHP